MIGNKKILCVITARAGSRGISGKNYRDLLGKPLFMWSVLASLQSKYIDCTSVSSNCKQVYEILDKFVTPKISKRASLPVRDRWQAGPVPFFIQRPDEISGDLSKNEDALIHALNFYKNRGESEYDIVCNLQPTSPVRLDFLLDKSIEAYYNGGHDSLLTANKKTPFFWQIIENEWKYIDRYFSLGNIKKSYQTNKQWQMVKSFDDCCSRKMRQELEEQEFLYHDCGNIYITDKEILVGTECRIGDKPCVFEVDNFNSLQIDTEFDFELIEKMAEVRGLKSLV